MNSDFLLNHPDEIYTILLQTSIMCLVIFCVLFYFEKSGKKNKPPIKKNLTPRKKHRRNKRK